MLYNVLLNGNRIELDTIIDITNSSFINTFLSNQNWLLTNVGCFTDSYWSRSNDLVTAEISLPFTIPDNQWFDLTPNAENIITIEGSNGNKYDIKFTTPLDKMASSWDTPKKLTICENDVIVNSNQIGIPTTNPIRPLTRVTFLQFDYLGAGSSTNTFCFLFASNVGTFIAYTCLCIYSIKYKSIGSYVEYIPPTPPIEIYPNLKIAMLNDSFNFE